jgi:magnesium-protoporphyrin IX monomethyl ester (oxidative) cyclase
MDDQGDHIQLTDTRGCATQPRHVLAGLAREVYLACDAAPRRARLAQAVPSATDEQLAAVTGQLLADHLVIEMDGRLIALAVPTSGAATPDHTQFPGGHVFAGAGRPDAASR